MFTLAIFRDAPIVHSTWAGCDACSTSPSWDVGRDAVEGIAGRQGMRYDDRRLTSTVLAMITGNLDDAGQPTSVLVDPKTSDTAGSGLNGPSPAKCYNLATTR